jgi:hypothetical protein
MSRPSHTNLQVRAGHLKKLADGLLIKGGGWTFAWSTSVNDRLLTIMSRGMNAQVALVDDTPRESTSGNGCSRLLSTDIDRLCADLGACCHRGVQLIDPAALPLLPPVAWHERRDPGAEQLASLTRC